MHISKAQLVLNILKKYAVEACWYGGMGLSYNGKDSEKGWFFPMNEETQKEFENDILRAAKEIGIPEIAEFEEENYLIDGLIYNHVYFEDSLVLQALQKQNMMCSFINFHDIICFYGYHRINDLSVIDEWTKDCNDENSKIRKYYNRLCSIGNIDRSFLKEKHGKVK